MARTQVMPAHIDDPLSDVPVDPLCFLVRGWIWLEDAHENIAAIEAWSGGSCLGQTHVLYERSDVSIAHGLPPSISTGFELFAHLPGPPSGGEFPLRVTARLRGEERERERETIVPVAERKITAIKRDYRRNHFGNLLDARTTAIQGRDNVFAQGPSLATGSGELAALLRRYLGPPPRRIIDVGCGLGSYGRELIAGGYDWLGVEIDPNDCAELARLGLPHRQVDGQTLPFADGEFDAALCLEVLEHVDDPRAFLAEIRRVAPRQLLVSVPNCELLGYLWDHRAAPWHMLEADHKHFFTRWSLGALLREFYPQVEVRFHTPYPLRTIEGTPLYYHLFAVATANRT